MFKKGVLKPVNIVFGHCSSLEPATTIFCRKRVRIMTRFRGRFWREIRSVTSPHRNASLDCRELRGKNECQTAQGSPAENTGGAGRNAPLLTMKINVPGADCRTL